MNKTASIILSIALFLSLGILFSSKTQNNTPSVQNVEIRDGVQYVTIIAKAGYSPNVSLAQAGVPTKLIMETKNSFDCSSSVVIRDLDYQNFLPANSLTEIDVGIKEKGETLQGLCSMCMYNFEVKFE